MRVCLLTAEPDHPLLHDFRSLVAVRHRVEVLDPDAVPVSRAAAAVRASPADVYLLKAHTPNAIALARAAEDAGARVVNTAAATDACQSRVTMADRARRAGLPFPVTQGFGRLSGLLAHAENAWAPAFPAVVKSQVSTRNDLVARVGGRADLRALADRWAHEPVVVQPHVENDGWDHKFWVVGCAVFVGLRRTALDEGARRATLPLDPADVPAAWLDAVRAVGRVFDLTVYGVDVVATARGPLIVDVNAFPGCRGMRGAPEALALLVDRLGPSCVPTVLPTGTHREPAGPVRAAPALPRPDRLHRAVDELVEPVAAALPEGARPRLSVGSLRRKAGRGLVATYRGRSADGPVDVVVTVPEQMLEADNGPTLSSDALTVQTLPDDAALPGLARALAPAAGSALERALAGAHRAAEPGTGSAPPQVTAEVVRHKPGSRCVVRYRVRSGAGAPELTVYGKLYHRPADAAAAHRVATRLWTGAVAPPVPRPIALVEELSLALNGAAWGPDDRAGRPGTAVLHRGAPDAVVAGAGTALAALHRCRPHPDLAGRAVDTAAKARGWASALGDQVPWLAGELADRAVAVGVALDLLGRRPPVPVHGAYKPSQLVYGRGPAPLLTDLDGVRLDDPAADVGYFLAYLRPSGFWQGRAGTRTWHDHAREVFVGTYVEAMSPGGNGGHAELSRRAAVYEAAVLLKIASRRARRLNSPRPTEVAAVLAEIDACLRRYTRGRQYAS